MQRGLKNLGTLTVHAEEAVASRNAVEITFRCSHLDNKDLFSESDPFLRISRIVESGGSVPICKTEVVNNNLNPIWKPVSLTMQQFGSKDNPLVIECFDFNSDGNHVLIGVRKKQMCTLVNIPRNGKYTYGSLLINLSHVAPNGELETEAKVVNIPSSCSMEFDAQTMNDLPEVEVISPEEVSAVACDDKPDRLEMAQLYNEMCKVLGQNANESMQAFLANKPAGFKLKKNLLPLETIYQDMNRILSPVQQDSSSLEPQIQKADSHSEMPTEIAGPNLLSTLQGDEHKSGPEATTVKSGPETECSNRSTTEPDYEKEKSNSPSCEVVAPAADSCPPQTQPICSTNGIGADVEMEELRDADSSADEPTEESADKSDPGVIVLDD